MNGTTRWIDFELPSEAIGLPVSVRIADHGDRWMAAVRCGSRTYDGIGLRPREALIAALMPFGRRASAALMAQPVMFGASADLLACG